MADKRKVRVMVVYGGKSGEHEVSLHSAASVIRNLDRSRFEIITVSIDKKGVWRANDLSLLEAGAKAALPVFKDAPEVVLPFGRESGAELVAIGPGSAKLPASLAGGGIDVVFPVMHGPLCEDGAIQGLFEIADVAYVGTGVLGSAVGMDKEVAKRLIREAGIETPKFLALRSGEWARPGVRDAIFDRIEKELGNYPVFVKPANMGSSVGIHKVKSRGELLAAIDDAFRFDLKILIEEGIDARELEVSILESLDARERPKASVVGEIIATHDFYSYDAKYLDSAGAKLKIPADIPDELSERVRELAVRIFEVLNGNGLSRVDLFLDRKSGRVLFNEVNTMPGFTSISMYPKMWEASGVSYSELLSRLVELAIARHAERRRLVRDRG